MTPPIIKGGQGRTPADLADTATVLGIVFIACMAGLILLGVLA